MSDKGPDSVYLTVVFPAYNAEKHISASLATAAAYLGRQPFASEIIVVDDGSADRTAETAREALAGLARSRVIRRERNLGKGASVREGVLAAAGEVVLFSDDDLSTPIGEFDKLRAALEAGADAAIGSRALPGSDIGVRQGRLRETMGKSFNLLVRLLVLKGYRDTQCGFKAFRRAAAAALFSRLETPGFGFDVEILVLCRELGYRVAEVPVVWNDSRPSRLKFFGGSLAMLGELIRIRRRSRRRGAVR